MRDGAESASRPALGRPKLCEPDAENVGPDPPTSESQLTPTYVDDAVDGREYSEQNKQISKRRKGAKIQTSSAEPVGKTLSGKPPHPNYVKKGPIITTEMFNKWTPDMLRPVRSTRNPNPMYVEAIAA